MHQILTDANLPPLRVCIPFKQNSDDAVEIGASEKAMNARTQTDGMRGRHLFVCKCSVCKCSVCKCGLQVRHLEVVWLEMHRVVVADAYLPAPTLLDPAHQYGGKAVEVGASN